MDSVIRALVVYGFLLLIFRLAGKRTLSQTSNFDLVMLLIISETTQQAMVDNDHSVTNGFLLILTLVGTTIVLSIVKQHFPAIERLLDGAPLALVDHGRLHQEHMDKERVDEQDLLEAARMLQGLERTEQIKHAVIERNGEISIVPEKT